MYFYRLQGLRKDMTGLGPVVEFFCLLSLEYVGPTSSCCKAEALRSPTKSPNAAAALAKVGLRPLHPRSPCNLRGREDGEGEGAFQQEEEEEGTA